MQLDQKRNKGQKIKLDGCNARITNSSVPFEAILKNIETNKRIGFHSESEFLYPKSTYLYIDGELEDIDSWDEMDLKGLDFTFTLLRKIQYLTHYFWAVEDNNIYVRDGFLITYKKRLFRCCYI